MRKNIKETDGGGGGGTVHVTRGCRRVKERVVVTAATIVVYGKLFWEPKNLACVGVFVIVYLGSTPDAGWISGPSLPSPSPGSNKKKKSRQLAASNDGCSDTWYTQK